MAFERVARFARLAASDSGVLAALQEDPESIRRPLELSEAQVRALISASAFTSDRPVRTTSRADDPVGDVTNLMELGTLGTLLPPEGSGAFPAAGDLPPAPLAPKSVAPKSVTPSPAQHSGNGTPKAAAPTSTVAPHAPQSVAPSTPVAPSRGASSPTAPPQAASTPTASPRAAVAVQSSGAPVLSSPLSGPAPSTPVAGAGQISGSPQPTVTTPSVGWDTSSQVDESFGIAQAPTMPAPRIASYTVPMTTPMTAGPCDDGCRCDVAMIAIVAQVSATAQSAITAITAIAGMN